jgi:hypothetical protein
MLACAGAHGMLGPGQATDACIDTYAHDMIAATPANKYPVTLFVWDTYGEWWCGLITFALRSAAPARCACHGGQGMMCAARVSGNRVVKETALAYSWHASCDHRHLMLRSGAG